MMLSTPSKSSYDAVRSLKSRKLPIMDMLYMYVSNCSTKFMDAYQDFSYDTYA